MIHFTSINKSFPDKVLFRDMNLVIRHGARIGLVGPNGSGKTTILRMIVGEDAADSGAVQIEGKLSMGYLPQEINYESDKPILLEVLSEFPEIAELEEHILTLSQRVTDNPDDTRMLSRLGVLQTKYEQMDGWSLESRAKKVLGGLGFTPEQMQTSFKTFSGGWRMRIALAKLLFREPDILLLDEPTNHLDLESLLWLESFLSDWKGTLLLISHDRTFLDKTINQVMEIHHQKVQNYSGNYSRYMEEKQLREEQQGAAYKNQQKYIAETERFIERFRYKDSKAKQVQSRVKTLEKLERIPPPETVSRGITVRIPQPGRSPRIVAEFKDTDKAYGPNEVFKSMDFLLERGKKIGLVGPNGAGKSTFLKMLAEVEPLTGGTLKWGEGVSKAYFAQHQFEALPLEKSIYESMATQNPKWTVTEVRTYLGSFLFSGDTIDKKIEVLSGGELSRLALARMLAVPSHLILLDEPTNHLDIRARDVVQRAVSDFTGTMVCISHDRHFLNAVTDTIVEIDGGELTVYPGNYEYYEWRKTQVVGVQAEPTRSPDQKEAEPAAMNFAERKKLANRLKKLPELIEACENNIQTEEQVMANPENASDYTAIQAAMDRKAELEEQYLELLQELEELQERFK